jgi:hypothetical protein
MQSLLLFLGKTCLHQMLPRLIKQTAVLLSLSDNYFTIPPSAKVVDIEVIWPFFVAFDVQAV